MLRARQDTRAYLGHWTFRLIIIIITLRPTHLVNVLPLKIWIRFRILNCLCLFLLSFLNYQPYLSFVSFRFFVLFCLCFLIVFFFPVLFVFVFLLLSLIVADFNRPISFSLLYLLLIYSRHGPGHRPFTLKKKKLFSFVFILIVLRRFFFQNHRPICINNLFSHLPFPRFCYLSRASGRGGGGVGGCMMIQTFPFFNHEHIYFYVLLSLPFIFPSAVFMVHIILCWPVTVVYLI